MSKNDLLIAVLAKLNENQLALGAAVEELTNWVEQRGSVKTVENIRSALGALDNNLEFINLSLAVLDSPE